MSRATIRFVGEKGKAWYFLKLGPMDQLRPPEREFQGGDELVVGLTDCVGKPDVVDLVLPDGVVVHEVPREFFSVLDSTSRRS